MSSEWNRAGVNGRGYVHPTGTTVRELAGIAFQSEKKAGYTSYWRTINKRVVVSRKGKTDDYSLFIDGKQVHCIGCYHLREMVRSNEIYIRKAL